MKAAGQHISKNLSVNLPTSSVWGVMKDYGNIEHYAPTIKESVLLNDTIGVGAKRKVTFHHDGSSLIEEITDYTEGQGYKMEVTEVSSPVKSMQAKMEIEKISNESCKIHMTVQFEVESGVISWLMGNLLMKPIMQGAITKVITGLAYYAATGCKIDTKLPPKQKMLQIIS